jgi:hypothetical protein
MFENLEYSDVLITIGVVSFIVIGLRILFTLKKIKTNLTKISEHLDPTTVNTICYDEDAIVEQIKMVAKATPPVRKVSSKPPTSRIKPGVRQGGSGN